MWGIAERNQSKISSSCSSCQPGMNLAPRLQIQILSALFQLRSTCLTSSTYQAEAPSMSQSGPVAPPQSFPRQPCGGLINSGARSASFCQRPAAAPDSLISSLVSQQFVAVVCSRIRPAQHYSALIT
ncbi:hypothetical protein MY5147_000180 [Beauveria neobassiana]